MVHRLRVKTTGQVIMIGHEVDVIVPSDSFVARIHEMEAVAFSSEKITVPMPHLVVCACGSSEEVLETDPDFYEAFEETFKACQQLYDVS